MKQKIYWRVRRDVKKGSLSWRAGWIIDRPAQGLMEIGSTPTSLTGTVMSENDIVFKPRLDVSKELKAERTVKADLLAACEKAKKFLEPDLVEPGRTVFWELVFAIAKAKGKS